MHFYNIVTVGQFFAETVPTVDRIEIKIRVFETNMKSLGKCLLTYLVDLYSLQFINLWLRLPTNWSARSDPCYDSNSDFFHDGKLAESKSVRHPRNAYATKVPFPGLAYEVMQSSHVIMEPQANKIAARGATATPADSCPAHVPAQASWPEIICIGTENQLVVTL